MIVVIFVFLWRTILFGISFVTSEIYQFTPRFPYSNIYLIPTGLPQWIWAWANFDGVHYLTIATRGYFAQFTQAFFPLYPLLTHLVATILFKQYIFAGIGLSFVCFCIATVYFNKLLLLDYKKEIVIKILLAMFLFPTSFYFAALYTEGLFFLLTILSFWFARRDKWVFAGICGGLAALTRITGIFLLPALLLEWLLMYRKNILFRRQKNRIYNFIYSAIKYITKSFSSPILYLIPFGLFLYMGYLYLFHGDALYFWHAQSAFGAERSVGFILPPQVLWRYLKILISINIFSLAFFNAFLELLAYMFGILGLLLGYKLKIRLSYLIFSWLVIFIPALTGTFSSMPRYILLAFPLYIVLGCIRNKYMQYAIFVGSFVLQLLLTSLFIRGLWVA